MKNTSRLALLLAAPLALGLASAADASAFGPLKVSADRMAADNVTGTLVASGHVHAVAHPVCLLSDLVTKRGDVYAFAEPTRVTTCTNAEESLHWSVTGDVTYREGKHVVLKDLVLRAWGVPVLWLPYWYYPLDTDYGWRVMPGYSSRWGGYLLTKYVYGLAESPTGDYRLGGATRFDMRTKNGFAAGQSVNWKLGDFGHGKFKVYYAWDLDADHYDHHWRSERDWHYENWGSKVPDERYGLMLSHLWEPTERDTVRLKGAYYSDSHFRSDFLRNGLFGTRNKFVGSTGNEAAWEHVENFLGAGVSVSGPLNDFWGGVARLPEAYVDIQPMPVFGLRLNYESSSKIGFYNRNYAKHGDRTTAYPYRYDPGLWADYQTFRFDTYHRLTLPFRVADIVSVVPRAAVRGTYWDDTGRPSLDGTGRAGSVNDSTTRAIVEGGLTLAARGSAWFGEEESYQHVIEPYTDFLAQEARYHGLQRGARPYVFDSIDASRDWLDQFAGRSRNLPYTWYGVTPGLRNALRHTDESGRSRTLVDFDAYAAVQFNDTSYTEGGRYHQLARNPANPNYGRNKGAVMPGARLRWFPAEDCALRARAEYDTENDTLAYADVAWRQVLTPSLKWELSFNCRDQRWWDYSSSPYDRAVQKNEDFNLARFTSIEVTFEHEVCDALAWGPFVRWDCREEELDEIGTWLDIRTDCLGFRFSVSYENDYERIDYSKTDDDWRFGFFVYLRALGPSNGSPF